MSADTDRRPRPLSPPSRASTVVDLAAAATTTLVALKSVAVRLDAEHTRVPAKSNATNIRRAAGLLTLLGLALLSLIHLPRTPLLTAGRGRHTLPTPRFPSTDPTTPLPPYSCASAFLHTSNPPCACTVACEPLSTCCPDFARVSHAVTSHLIAAGIITGPIRRDLGANMTAAWSISQWRRTTSAQVLVVGQACVRYPTAAGAGFKWECADQAHVVQVHAEVQPGWVDYVVRGYAPPDGKRVPALLDVGLGSVRAPNLPADLFYLRLTDPASILAVLMSTTARLHYCGLSLALDTRGRNGRADWDPTPQRQRDWHALSTSTYLLTRGAASPIEYDASPRGVDAEYEKVVRESGGRVVPWMACHVRRIRVRGKGWVNVVDRATGKWVDIEDDGVWFDDDDANQE